MPEVIEDLAHHGEIIPVVGGQASQWKDLQKATATKNNQEQNTQYKSRNGISNQDHGASDCIKATALAYCFGNAQRNGYQIAYKKGP